MLRYVPVSSALLAATIFVAWLVMPARVPLTLRTPGADGRPDNSAAAGRAANPVLLGSVITGPGTPAEVSGSWTRFRGDDLSAIGRTPATILRQWSETGPRKLWSLDVGEGYAGAAVWNGRVFIMDYDREKKHEALRAVSLADGKEIWRYSFPNTVKRDHGVTRTVPSVSSNYVVAIGPKCHVLCVDTATGALKWSIDMAKDHGTVVPPWYTGQCPLVDGDRVILAPAGPKTLLMAVDQATGKVLWDTPNPHEWKMTHSSVMPVQFAGKRMYVYCGSGGVAGVAAEDGAPLWDTKDWKISLATVPCPIDVGGGRIFLTGGYNAGSLMLQLKADGERVVPEIAWRVKAEVFGATQHAPIFAGEHLYGIRADGRFVCLGLDGKVVWTSEPGSNFGLGAFCIVNDVIFALNDSGTLHMMEANPIAFKFLAKAKVLDGPEAWGPLAFAGGRLIARDLNHMVCLEVGGH